MSLLYQLRLQDLKVCLGPVEATSIVDAFVCIPTQSVGKRVIYNFIPGKSFIHLPVYPVGNPYSQTFLIFIQNKYYQLYDCIGIKKFFSLRKLMQWIIIVDYDQ
jgi:hypothetical protein